MKQYYTRGSEAYAPIPVEEPSHLPEDPCKARPAVTKAVKRRSPVVALAWAVAAVLVFGLVFSTMRLYEVRSERAELLQRQAELQQEQDELIMDYENAIDLDAVAERAEDMGMHPANPDQIRTIDLPEQEAPETQEEKAMGIFAAVRAMFLDMKEYFS